MESQATFSFNKVCNTKGAAKLSGALTRCFYDCKQLRPYADSSALWRMQLEPVQYGPMADALDGIMLLTSGASSVQGNLLLCIACTCALCMHQAEPELQAFQEMLHTKGMQLD